MVKRAAEYVSPARATMRTLGKLDRTLSSAQDLAGSLNVHESPFRGAKQLGYEIWYELEKARQRIRKMLERAERPGGIF
jgi:hypothetical protein